MLPAASRLRRRADFTATLRRARGTRAGGLVVVHVDSPDDSPVTSRDASQDASQDASPDAAAPGSPARVGFVVSRAVGPAVTRNLVKRRLRHVMARRVDELPVGSRVVVRALPASAVATSAALDAAVGRALAPRSRS